MDTPDLSRILADLAAGRIDAAEAGRLIEESQGRTPPEPDSVGDATAAQGEATAGSQEPSADQTSDDRPHDEQHPTGPSSSETWSQTSGAAQAAGDVLRDVFRSARQAATKAADAAAGYARERETHGTEQQPHGGGAATGRAAGSAERVSVRVTGRRVRIVVDSSVNSCHVTGEHVLRRNGDLIEVSAEGDFRPHLSGIKLPNPLNFEGLRRGRGNELLIRMNPSLALDVEVTAGSLQVSNVAHLGRVRVTGGGASIIGFEEVEDALLQAAIVQMAGRVRTGRSRIRVESGQLSLKLDDDSNVTVVAASHIGRVTWSGRHTGAGDQVVMGNGSARLDVTAVMGHAGVQVGTPVGESSTN